MPGTSTLASTSADHDCKKTKRSVVIGIERLGRLRISTKLSSVLGAALVALCVMGAIAVFAAREIQKLGQDLYVESDRLSNVQLTVSLEVERAIGHVHSAPSELDLAAAEDQADAIPDAPGRRQANAEGKPFRSHARSGVKASGANILVSIDAFEGASKEVFEKAAAFAQQEATAALSKTVAPKESALQAALKQFREAANQNNAAKGAAIRATSTTIASVVIGLAIFLVAGIAALGYATVSRGVMRPITAINGVMIRLSSGNTDGDIPYASRRDEIGDMAKAVEVFKENLIESKRADQRNRNCEQERKEQRANALDALIKSFEATVGKIVETVYDHLERAGPRPLACSSKTAETHPAALRHGCRSLRRGLSQRPVGRRGDRRDEPRR